MTTAVAESMRNGWTGAETTTDREVWGIYAGASFGRCDTAPMQRKSDIAGR